MNEPDTNPPSAADNVGQAAGGITGVIAGAAIGTTAGPIGTLLGGIAGAIGGWWSGRAIAEAAEDITEADEQAYRDHFTREQSRSVEYEKARRAYYLGDVAAANPEYRDRSFEDVEEELSSGWSRGADVQTEWRSVRDCACCGYSRGRERRKKPR